MIYTGGDRSFDIVLIQEEPKAAQPELLVRELFDAVTSSGAVHGEQVSNWAPLLEHGSGALSERQKAAEVP